MAKFKFIGEPKTKELMPDVVTAFGVEFKKGKASEVKDPYAIGKLQNNSHFAEVKASAPKKAETPKKEAAPKKAAADKGK